MKPRTSNAQLLYVTFTSDASADNGLIRPYYLRVNSGVDISLKVPPMF